MDAEAIFRMLKPKAVPERRPDGYWDVRGVPLPLGLAPTKVAS